MSFLQTLATLHPRAFHLQLTRSSCCHRFELHLPSHSILASPSGVYCDPLRDLLRAVVALNPNSPRSPGLDVSEGTSFSWDCELQVFDWKFRHLKRVAGIRLVVSYRPDMSAPSGQVIMDTVLEERELFHQIWDNARKLLLEGGMSYHMSHTPFPVREFWQVHELVTGNPVPYSLAEEMALLTQLRDAAINEREDA